jgi:hypothetical protein
MFRLTRVDLRPRLSAKNFPFMAAGFVIVAFFVANPDVFKEPTSGLEPLT